MEKILEAILVELRWSRRLLESIRDSVDTHTTIAASLHPLLSVRRIGYRHLGAKFRLLNKENLKDFADSLRLLGLGSIPEEWEAIFSSSLPESEDETEPAQSTLKAAPRE